MISEITQSEVNTGCAVRTWEEIPTQGLDAFLTLHLLGPRSALRKLLMTSHRSLFVVAAGASFRIAT